MEQTVKNAKAVRRAYQQYFKSALEEHNAVCNLKDCKPTNLKFTFKEGTVYPYVRIDSLSEVLLTADRTPVLSLQLADDAPTRKFIGPDGTFPCDCDGQCGSHGQGPSTEAYIHSSCHNDGIGFVVRDKSGSKVDLVCANKDCQNIIMCLDIAARPKVESPYLFCDFHGKQLAYMVCDHILQGQKPMILERSTYTSAGGTALCGDSCDRLTQLGVTSFKKNAHKFHRVCAGHLNDLLRGKLEQYLKEVEAVAA